MYRIQFSSSHTTYFLPENWSEVTAKQLYHFIEIVQVETDEAMAKWTILQEWLKINLQNFKELAAADNFAKTQEINRFFFLENEEKLIPIINGFLEYQGIESFIVRELIIPGLKKEKLIGPSDRLENISAEEFSLASHYYHLFTEDEKDMDSLYKFVACLYRSPRTDNIKPGDVDFDGDFRQPFNAQNVDSIADKIKKINPIKLLAVKFCYERTMKWIAEQPNFEEIFKPAKEKDGSMPDWDRVIRTIAGNKLGSIEQVRKIPILEVFQELQYLEEELQQAENNRKTSQQFNSL